MGGVVTRAYIKYRSGHGPGGQSRVRRYICAISPNRGLNDLEATFVALKERTFQRWGEVAEMARDYPGWSGQSYMHELNDGWDAWAVSHGVSYGGMFGIGHSIITDTTLQQAIDVFNWLIGNSSSPSSHIPGSGSGTGTPAGTPLGQGGTPSPPLAPPPSGTALGTGTGTQLQAVAQSLIFIDPTRLNLAGDLQEALSDGDGFVRASNASLAAGPEFPSRRFDMCYHGLHLDRGQPEEVIQFSTNARELTRRWCIEGRTPRGSTLASANVKCVAAGGQASWLEVDYDLQGSDGVGVELVTEDLAKWTAHQALPILADDPTVYGAPAFEGSHTLRFDGDPAGQRVATLYVYDVDGVVGQVGPIFYSGTPGLTGEVAPLTSASTIASGKTATVTLASNGASAEFSYRLVAITDPPTAPGAWSAWSGSNTVTLSSLSQGTYELFCRSRHSANAASVLVEERDPLELGVSVDASGTINVQR
jgi:hypothetical protein